MNGLLLFQELKELGLVALQVVDRLFQRQYFGSVFPLRLLVLQAALLRCIFAA